MKRSAMQLTPIGHVRSQRSDPADTDHWGGVIARIQLVAGLGGGALAGLEDFSHVEVLFWFHQVTPRSDYSEPRRPRGRVDLPAVGVFAGRGPNRPNLIGATICALVEVGQSWLSVRGLDAVDGTPVVDLKPVLSELLPAEIRQPDWTHELMHEYFVE